MSEPAPDTAPTDAKKPEKPDLSQIDPTAPLPRLRTGLTAKEVQERWSKANYRGRLPEIDWPEPGRRFKLDVLGNQLEHDVFGEVAEREDNSAREIRFEVRLKRLPLWIIIIFIIVSTPIGAYFMDMMPLLNRIPHPWIWFPIVNIGLSAWWLWAELKKTIPRAWWEARKHIVEKLAPEIEADVVE
ncbi:MAG: hypothetical protein ACF8NJ_05495 [Phycisphaerales bacterium JB038]